MDRVSAEFSLDPDGLCRNVETADGFRAARVEHSIEGGNADSRFQPSDQRSCAPVGEDR
jgi:hypothetical protein